MIRADNRKRESGPMFGRLVSAAVLADDTSGTEGAINLFAEVFLVSDQRPKFDLAHDTTVGIIPLVGTLGISYPKGIGGIRADPGKCCFIGLRAGAHYTVQGCGTLGPCNFIQIHLNGLKNGDQWNCEIDDLSINRLSMFEDINGIRLHFGIFEGRKKWECRFKENRKILAHVINGAFELEDRLLEKGDGLLLPGSDWIGMESLANNAMMLCMEMPVSQTASA